MDERETEELPVFRSWSLGPVYRDDLDRTIGVLQIMQQVLGEMSIEQAIQVLVGRQLEEKVLARRNKARKASVDSSADRGHAK